MPLHIHALYRNRFTSQSSYLRDTALRRLNIIEVRYRDLYQSSSATTPRSRYAEHTALHPFLANCNAISLPMPLDPPATSISTPRSPLAILLPTNILTSHNSDLPLQRPRSRHLSLSHTTHLRRKLIHPLRSTSQSRINTRHDLGIPIRNSNPRRPLLLTYQEPIP